MNRLTLAALLVVVVAGCSPSQRSASTTTEPSGTSSTTVSTAPSTTITTTTTTLPTTTTTTNLEGNWAPLPVITSTVSNMTLGWWDGTSWIAVDEGMTLPVEGGEDYQIALLGTEGLRTTGGPQVSGCDILFSEFPGIELADPEALFHPLQPGDQAPVSGVAISAPWDLTPHHVDEGEAHPDLEALGVELLSERGYETDSVEIVQAVDADLEGDGSIETIIAVEETHLANETSDVYSLVFVVSPGLDEPLVVDESVIPADSSGFPASFRVGAIADLNGDRLMEIVVDGVAWENSWISVYELSDGVFVERLVAGCGV